MLVQGAFHKTLNNKRGFLKINIKKLQHPSHYLGLLNRDIRVAPGAKIFIFKKPFLFGLNAYKCHQ